MSVVTQPGSIGGGQGQEAHEDNYLTAGKGLWSWLSTVDHKRIGLMYMGFVLFSFFLGGVFAIVVRTELLSNEWTLLADETASNDFYNHSFTLHGAVMTFLFIIPAIPAILGNFALPIMLGAKDVAFPKLNLTSWYLYMIGMVFFVWILLSGVIGTVLYAYGINPPDWLPVGLDTGWTFYTPYSTETGTQVVAATLGVFILGFSSILTGLNFIATVHTMRPKWMTWFHMPLFIWALYATALIQILATPVLAITLLLLAAERMLGIGIFDPALGGDPVLYQHFFWFYSHPAVYIMILPALGVVSELIGAFSRKHVFGYKFIAFSSVAIAVFGFIVWGHHMFTSGQSSMLNAIFSLLTMSVAIPSAIKVFNWLATMWRGQIRLDTPMLYAIGFIWLFAIGGLTGLFLATLSTDIFFHDTYFVVAHFHYVMVGSTLFAFIGGMYYWWPKMFGVMYNETTGRIGAIVTFIGFNATFFIQFLAGTKGMPRRYAHYLDEYAFYHAFSTYGSYLLSIGLFIVLYNWLHSFWAGRKASANPWGANTLEWYTTSPPPHHNFEGEAPIAGEPYDHVNWKYDEQQEGYVLREDPKVYAEKVAAAGGHH
ncbi:cytochrome c oxidase subunit I [Mucisphaera calidilacus]|uniref:Cytochrome c oxidase subunit 1 n=1 Tax=Mucisphaera calidilacus TaxID=2527982 RepID=A0A518C0E0_9BACT|nr:cbb3-type cytochrome c oxidase subunit I [Mucisphaera calidilacus]QDU72683.1 Cytochrome c oxidase subunit 1 [Mucisphaera calidilacus]